MESINVAYNTHSNILTTFYCVGKYNNVLRVDMLPAFDVCLYPTERLLVLYVRYVFCFDFDEVRCPT